MQSLKKELITSWGVSTTIDALKDKRLVLLTPAGLIIGTFVSSAENTDSETMKFLYDFSSNVARDYKEENNITTLLDGNDGFMSLKDVQINSGNFNLHLPFINIFYDQIIGVTITDSATN